MSKNIITSASLLVLLLMPLQALADMDLKACSDAGYLSEIMKDMRWYRVNNSSFHAGDDVYDHSAWSARAMEQWFVDGHKWVKDIPQNFQDAAILAAFLHDLGKAGDLDLKALLNPGWKEPHPQTGFAISIGVEPYYTINSGLDVLAPLEKTDLKLLQPSTWPEVPMTNEMSKFAQDLDDAAKGGKASLKANATAHNFDRLLRSCAMSDRESAMIKIAIGMHYNWGDFIVLNKENKEKGYEKYLTALFKHIKDSKSQALFHSKEWIAKLINFCVAVSNADLMGSQPVLSSSQRFPAINDNAITVNTPLEWKEAPYNKYNADGNYERHLVPFLEWYQKFGTRYQEPKL